MNKTKIILAVLLGGLLIAPSFKSSLHADPPRTADAVVLYAQLFGDNSDSTGYQYNGAFVYCSSSSQHSPKFTQFQYNAGRQLTSLGDALSELISQGYTIAHVEGNTYTMVRTAAITK